MNCPKCSSHTKTSNSRAVGNGRRRKRKCENESCGHEFHTWELLEGKGKGDKFRADLLNSARCESCGQTAELSEIYPAPDGTSTQRMYRCTSCLAESYTVESPGEDRHDAMALYGPVVVKRAGPRTPYDRDELARSLSGIRGKALDERTFRKLVSHIDERVSTRTEIISAEITDWTLDFLKEHSRLAYALHLFSLGRVADAEQFVKCLDEDDDE